MAKVQLTITVNAKDQKDAEVRAKAAEEVLKYIDTANLNYIAKKASQKGTNAKLTTARLTGMI